MRELSQEEVDQVGAGPSLPNLVPPTPTIPLTAANSLFPDAPPAFGSIFVPSAVLGGNAA